MEKSVTTLKFHNWITCVDSELILTIYVSAKGKFYLLVMVNFSKLGLYRFKIKISLPAQCSLLTLLHFQW
jgi:hypothetical protein